MRLLFLLLDFIVFSLLTAVVITIRSNITSYVYAFISNEIVMFPIFILNVFSLFIFSFYDFSSIYKSNKTSFRNLIIAFSISFVLSATGIYFGVNIFNIPTPKTSLLLILIFFYIYIFLSRKIYNSISFKKINIFILGNSQTLDKIKEDLEDNSKYKIMYNFNNIKDVPQNLNIKDIDLLLISNNFLDNNKTTSKILFKKFISNGIYYITDIDFFEQLYNKLSIEATKNINVLIKDINNKQRNSIYPVIKRFFDFIFSVILVPILFFVSIIIYFLILIIDKQNPIFLQQRVGFQSKPIKIYKFRTLIIGTEKQTKVGKILRKFRLDEIPQLINILKGDISFVGPRPLYLDDNNILNNYITINSLRNLIKPGLTGWAQINFKAPCNYSKINIPKFETEQQQNEFFKDAINRLTYDIWYVKNYSFFIDFEIILKTIKRIFIHDKLL